MRNGIDRASITIMMKKCKSAAFVGIVLLAGVAVVGCKETTKETEVVPAAPSGDTATAPAPDTSKTTESSTTTTTNPVPGGDSSTTTEKTTTEKKP